MIILGLNAFHGDSSAALVKDGKLVCAAEEERFRRIKHWSGLPTEAMKWCLADAGLKLSDVDHIAINRNPKANNLRRALYVLRKRPSLGPRVAGLSHRQLQRPGVAATHKHGGALGVVVDIPRDVPARRLADPRETLDQHIEHTPRDLALEATHTAEIQRRHRTVKAHVAAPLHPPRATS